MRLNLGLFACLLASLPISRADNSVPSTAIDSLPPCALTCLVSGLSNSTCSATDIACQCADTNLNNQVEHCVLGSCTISQALTTKNITSNICGIQPRDHSHVIGVLGVTGGTFAVTAVILRCIARLKSLGGGFWWDDWTIIFMAVLIAPFTGLTYIASLGRLGKDIWAIPLDDIIIFFHQFYFAEILYQALMPLTKTSILFFYLRIFPGVACRWITWCLIVITIISCTTFVCVNAFQCMPISYYWKQWNGQPGRCIAPSGPAWSVSIFGIILDFIMLGLPLYQIRKLNLHWRKRLHGTLMFSVGFFVTIVSILRLHSLVHFRNSTNPTYDYYSIGYWSIVEVNIGIICACMPSIRVLLASVFSRFASNSDHHTTFHSAGYQKASSGIHHAKSHAITYDTNLSPEQSKLVQMEDMAADGNVRSCLALQIPICLHHRLNAELPEIPGEEFVSLSHV